MTKPTITQADVEAADKKAYLLERELDITNADHIALWLEHNFPEDEPVSKWGSWLACRIIEAHEIEVAKHRLASEARVKELEEALQNFRRDLLNSAARDFAPHGNYTGAHAVHKLARLAEQVSNAALKETGHD